MLMAGLDPRRYGDNGKKLMDDFEWQNYTDQYYVREIKQGMQNDKQVLLFDKSEIVNNQLIVRENIEPHIVDICNDILHLRPQITGVFECGAGAGYRMYNIKKMFPNINISGCDLLKSQINASADLGVPKEIADGIMTMDFTEPGIVESIKAKIGFNVDYVFTQAVIMHLTHDRAAKFIGNMASFNANYVCLHESKASQFDWDDILKDSGILEKYNKIKSWEDNCYYMLFVRK